MSVLDGRIHDMLDRPVDEEPGLEEITSGVTVTCQACGRVLVAEKGILPSTLLVPIHGLPRPCGGSGRIA